MARKRQIGFRSFPYPAVDTPELDKLVMSYGHSGLIVWVRVMQEIYRSDNAQLDISTPAAKQRQAERCQVPLAEWQEIIEFCVGLDLFSLELLESTGQLTHPSIQLEFAKAERDRQATRDRAAKLFQKAGPVAESIAEPAGKAAEPEPTHQEFYAVESTPGPGNSFYAVESPNGVSGKKTKVATKQPQEFYGVESRPDPEFYAVECQPELGHTVNFAKQRDLPEFYGVESRPPGGDCTKPGFPPSLPPLHPPVPTPFTVATGGKKNLPYKELNTTNSAHARLASKSGAAKPGTSPDPGLNPELAESPDAQLDPLPDAQPEGKPDPGLRSPVAAETPPPLPRVGFPRKKSALATQATISGQSSDGDQSTEALMAASQPSKLRSRQEFDLAKTAVAIPQVLDTPEFREYWQGWLEARFRFKRPANWEAYIRKQFKILTSENYPVALCMAQRSYQNEWMGICHRPMKSVMKGWLEGRAEKNLPVIDGTGKNYPLHGDYLNQKHGNRNQTGWTNQGNTQPQPPGLRRDYTNPDY